MKLLERIADLMFGRQQLHDDPETVRADEVDRRVKQKLERLRAEARGWLHQEGA